MLMRGNEGVAGRVLQTEYSIGYAEFGFAQRLGLQMAELENAAGAFVGPSIASGEAALAGSAAEMPENLRLFIADPAGAGAYPIATFSWLLLYASYPDEATRAAVAELRALRPDRRPGLCAELGYIPLPRPVVARRWRLLTRHRLAASTSYASGRRAGGIPIRRGSRVAPVPSRRCRHRAVACAEVQRDFSAINARLRSQRDPMSDDSSHAMLAGYAHGRRRSWRGGSTCSPTAIPRSGWSSTSHRPVWPGPGPAGAPSTSRRPKRKFYGGAGAGSAPSSNGTSATARNRPGSVRLASTSVCSASRNCSSRAITGPVR